MFIKPLKIIRSNKERHTQKQRETERETETESKEFITKNCHQIIKAANAKIWNSARWIQPTGDPRKWETTTSLKIRMFKISSRRKIRKRQCLNWKVLKKEVSFIRGGRVDYVLNMCLTDVWVRLTWTRDGAVYFIHFKC